MDGYEFASKEELINYLDNNDSNYISDRMSELSDAMIDIYNYDLRKWAVDNYEYIEDAMDELGVPSPFDFHKAIQAGQYIAYNREFCELADDFKQYVKELDEDEDAEEA